MDHPNILLTPLTSKNPPSSFLPPLAHLQAHSAQDVFLATQRLRNMCWLLKAPFLPKDGLPKRSITLFIHDHAFPDSGYASAEEEEESEDITTDSDNDPDFEILGVDSFERAFAIRWATGFISRSEMWIALSTNDEDNDMRSQVLDEVTCLLSMFSTDEGNRLCPEGKGLTRSFSFPSPGGTIDVELNDAPLLEDDHTSVGLQSWGSAIVLAQKMSADPACFSLSLIDTDETRPFRVLELGAGTGMLSIVTARILHAAFPPPVIIATDYHPDVMTNLSANVRANFPAGPCSQLPVTVHVLDWEDPVYSAPLDERFDLVLAADVVYHPTHARSIRGCVEMLLARNGTFWMIMAMRTSGRHEGLDATVGEMFPGESVVERGALAVLGSMDVGRLEGVGRADENEYKLFKIGWKDSDCHSLN